MSSHVISWPAPAGEAPSPDYTVTIDDCPVFVYAARVRAEIQAKEGLWSHRVDCGGERAAFVIFDMDGPVTVVVRGAFAISSAEVLPARAGIVPEVAEGVVRFTLAHPQPLTLLPNGADGPALHLFAGAPETDVPRPDDPDVLYFGPGIHEVTTVDLHSGQTVYLAGGAVVRGVLAAGETGKYDEKWHVTFYKGTVFHIDHAQGVRICGRGILDGSLIPHPGRNLIGIHHSSDVQLSGIVLRDAPNWNMIINRSHDVQVDGLRLLSGRLNSDGINSVNSQRVHIHDCFVRNHDDSIVVKTTQQEPPAEQILVENCVIWNDWGYALGVTYETRADVRHVTFRHCDVIFARHNVLGIRVSDSGTISDITFADITVHTPPPSAHQREIYGALTTAPKWLAMYIGADCWGHDDERGHIRNVTVDGLTIYCNHMLDADLHGADAEHNIRHVAFSNIRLAGQPPITDLAELNMTTSFAEDVTLEGG